MRSRCSAEPDRWHWRQDHPVTYFSKVLPREEKYSTIENECLAIKLTIQYFCAFQESGLKEWHCCTCTAVPACHQLGRGQSGEGGTRILATNNVWSHPDLQTAVQHKIALWPPFPLCMEPDNEYIHPFPSSFISLFPSQPNIGHDVIWFLHK